MAERPVQSGDVTGWARVWALLDERRVLMGWSKREFYSRTGTSDGTYRRMAQGIGITAEHKKRVIAGMVGWTADSIDRILAGLDPLEGTHPNFPRAEFEARTGRPSQLAASESDVLWQAVDHLAEVIGYLCDHAGIDRRQLPGGEVLPQRRTAD